MQQANGLLFSMISRMKSSAWLVTPDSGDWTVPRRGGLFSFAQQILGSTATVVVHSNVDPAGLGDSVRRAIREVDRDAPVSSVRTMNDVMERSIAQRKFNTVLMTCFAVVALLLASIAFTE